MVDGGVYRRCGAAFAAGTAAVFLDRDGVIVEETGYLHRVEEMRLIPRAAEAIAELNRRSVPVVVVTNQAGIAHGYYDWDAFRTLQLAMEEELALAGARLDGVWACGVAVDHPFRKPNPGMILDAAERLNIDLSRSALVGDKTIDIRAAQNAGLALAVLVRTGYGREMEAELATLPPSPTQVRAAEDVRDALSYMEFGRNGE